jgi:hypothetical protein
VTSADFQASDCSAYNVCTTTTPRSFKSSVVTLGRRSPSIALSRNAASYCPRLRFLSQAATSTVASTQRAGIIACARSSVKRAPIPGVVAHSWLCPDPGATEDFSRRPLSRHFRPFIGPTFNARSGSCTHSGRRRHDRYGAAFPCAPGGLLTDSRRLHRTITILHDHYWPGRGINSAALHCCDTMIRPQNEDAAAGAVGRGGRPCPLNQVEKRSFACAVEQRPSRRPKASLAA